MKSNALDTANALTDRELLVRLGTLAGEEREATAELVAHLAALDGRPSVYGAQGCGSLFAYCTQELRLSEDAACNRIEAARACRSFPVILEDLSSGALSLASIRILRRHLTAENHPEVLARARGRSRREVEVLIAHLAPTPDARSVVQRLPVEAEKPKLAEKPREAADRTEAAESRLTNDSAEQMSPELRAVLPGLRPAATSLAERMVAPFRSIATSNPRPAIQPTAPQRYRVHFTIGEAAHDRLRRLQTLLRREIPDGDPGAIFDRAVALLLADVERRKLGKGRGAAIRPGTDAKLEGGATAPTADIRTPPPRTLSDIRSNTVRDIRRPPLASRHVPLPVRRAVWDRDLGQCAFVSPDGRRCTERSFLEFHHLHSHALGGPPTVGNMALRCRHHNQYEGELVFGPRPRPLARGR
jgi:hypothetical protein